MGNEISTVGGAVATAATSVAAGVTFGQVDALNNAVVECAKFTSRQAQDTSVRRIGEAAVYEAARELSTVGGAIATAATSVAAGVTLGQVDALNNAVVDCAKFTAKSAQETSAARAVETAAHAAATVGTAVAAGVTLGQVDVLNKAVEDSAKKTAQAAGNLVGEGTALNAQLRATGELVDGITDSVPGIAHVKGGILYAVGENERAERAMKGGSRTVGVIGGGVAGFVVGGPAGAVVGGIAGGAAMDGIITGVDSAVKQEFRPAGQIAAWDAAVKAKSNDDIIQGAIGIVLAPVMDGVAGLGAGKAYEQWKVGQEFKQLERHLEGEGGVGLDEAFEAMDRIANNEKVPVAAQHQQQPELIEEAHFDGGAIPREAIADEASIVYRGNQWLLLDEQIDALFENGVEGRGAVNDALLHALGDPDVHCNFVSSSKQYNVARKFGRRDFSKMREGRVDVIRRNGVVEPDMAFMKINPKRGIDLQITADMLDSFNPYPKEFEVSLFRGVSPQNIEGVVVRYVDGKCEWRANPAYVPPPPPPVVDIVQPAAEANKLAALGAGGGVILVVNEAQLRHAMAAGSDPSHAN